jgi:hypothetical protein
MGITYSKDEVSSEEAYLLPTIARFIIDEGSYYEMTQTDCLHFVKPMDKRSMSIMITKDMYPESSFRKESLDVKLEELSEERKIDLLKNFYTYINKTVYNTYPSMVEFADGKYKKSKLNPSNDDK